MRNGIIERGSSVLRREDLGMITLEDIAQVALLGFSCIGIFTVLSVGYMVYTVWKLERDSNDR